MVDVRLLHIAVVFEGNIQIIFGDDTLALPVQGLLGLAFGLLRDAGIVIDHQHPGVQDGPLVESRADRAVQSVF